MSAINRTTVSHGALSGSDPGRKPLNRIEPDAGFLKHRGMMCTACVAALIAAFGAGMTAQVPQPDRSAKFYENDRYVPTQLGPRLYMLTLAHRDGKVTEVMERDWRGNAVLLVGDDDTFLVDTTYDNLLDKLQPEIVRITAKPVKTLVITHSHPDHSGAIAAFRKQGAQVFAHPGVVAEMNAAAAGAAGTSKPAAITLPNVTFTEQVTFSVNDETIRVFHVPHAHTSGDSMVFFEHANTLATGDIFFAGLYPVIALNLGGSVQGTIAACDRILAMIDDNTTLVPGHGPVQHKAALVTYRNGLDALRREVAALVAEGKDLKQILALHPKSLDLPMWQPWSRVPTERLVEVMVDEATGKYKALLK